MGIWCRVLRIGGNEVVEANVLSIDDAEALFWSQSVEEL
jgi:hypothetical protein